MAKYNSATAALEDALSRVANALANIDSSAELTTWEDLRKEYAEIKESLSTGGGGSSGAVLQVKSLFTNTISSQSVADVQAQNTISGFELAITPTSATSKIIVQICVQASVAASESLDDQLGGLFRGTTALGNTVGMNGFAQFQTNFYTNRLFSSYQFVDSPNTTDQIVYKPTVACLSNTGDGILYFNRNPYMAESGKGASSILLMEVAP